MACGLTDARGLSVRCPSSVTDVSSHQYRFITDRLLHAWRSSADITDSILQCIKIYGQLDLDVHELLGTMKLQILLTWILSFNESNGFACSVHCQT